MHAPIPASQLSRAAALAGAYGHEWANTVDVSKRSPAPGGAWSIALIEACVLVGNADGPDLPGGISAPGFDRDGRLAHRTGSGRTVWAIERDGTAHIAITRAWRGVVAEMTGAGWSPTGKCSWDETLPAELLPPPGTEGDALPENQWEPSVVGLRPTDGYDNLELLRGTVGADGGVSVQRAARHFGLTAYGWDRCVPVGYRHLDALRQALCAVAPREAVEAALRPLCEGPGAAIVYGPEGAWAIIGMDEPMPTGWSTWRDNVRVLVRTTRTSSGCTSSGRTYDTPGHYPACEHRAESVVALVPEGAECSWDRVEGEAPDTVHDCPLCESEKEAANVSS